MLHVQAHAEGIGEYLTGGGSPLFHLDILQLDLGYLHGPAPNTPPHPPPSPQALPRAPRGAARLRASPCTWLCLAAEGCNFTARSPSLSSPGDITRSGYIKRWEETWISARFSLLASAGSLHSPQPSPPCRSRAPFCLHRNCTAGTGLAAKKIPHFLTPLF